MRPTAWSWVIMPLTSARPRSPPPLISAHWVTPSLAAKTEPYGVRRRATRIDLREPGSKVSTQDRNGGQGCYEISGMIRYALVRLGEFRDCVG
jgi:hypothetical protein